MWVDFFHDKFAGDHSYVNEITCYTKIEDLLTMGCDVYSGKEAIDNYCKFVNEYEHKEKYYEILQKPLLYNFYTYYKDANVPHVYFILSVNIVKLEKYVKKNKPIPFIDNLKQTFIWHNNYNKKNVMYFYAQQNQFEEIFNNNLNFISKSNGNSFNDYTNDKVIIAPNFVRKLTLMKYQLANLAWMLDIENNNHVIDYYLNDGIEIGNMYFDLFLKKISMMDEKPKIEFKGGALIDEVGLGKTIQMITLSLLNTPEKSNLYNSRSTLVLCPNQLCKQWEREIKDKINKDLNIIVIATKRDFDKTTYQQVLDADFVIVSFHFFNNVASYNFWINNITPKISLKKPFDDTIKEKLNNYFDIERKKLVDDGFDKSGIIFSVINWNRIIVDEFHEIFTIDKYAILKNLLPLINAKNKWIVTATPFIKTELIIDSIQFLTNNNFKKKLLLNDKLLDYVNTQIYRRNTKKSIEAVEKFSLPGMKEQIMWLNFTPVERMMYMAHIIDADDKKSQTFLQQICCHPQLANETKSALVNCKSLSEIENVMLGYYKKEVEIETQLYNKVVNKLEHYKEKYLEEKILLIIRRIKSMSKKLDIDFEEDDYKPVKVEKKFLAEIKNTYRQLYVNFNDDDKEKYKIKSVALETYNDLIKKYVDKLSTRQKILDSKNNKVEFYTNVMNKINSSHNRNLKTIKYDNFDFDDDCDLMDMIDEDELENEEEDEGEICGICLSIILPNNIGVTTCGHMACYTCLAKSITKNKKCYMCMKKLTIKDVYTISYTVPQSESNSSKELISMIEKIGTKLANLVHYLKTSNEHTIIFSQWDDMLRKIGHTLTEHKINNAFCSGSCYQRDKIIREFNHGDNMKVILLSSNSAAAGTNLTKASQIIFFDPIYGNRRFRKYQERQAIGRAHRMGQTKEIKIIRFVVKNTIEEEIYWGNVKDDNDAEDDNNTDTTDKTEIEIL